MRYLSDEEIVQGYMDICENETIIKVEFRNNGDSGFLQIELPQNEERNKEISKKEDYEDDDLLDEEKSESFIIYDNGQIAFDKWYPEKVHNHLVKAILKEYQESEEKTHAQEMSLEKYKDLLD